MSQNASTVDVIVLFIGRPTAILLQPLPLGVCVLLVIRVPLAMLRWKC